MRYVKINEGILSDILPSKPNWFFDDGTVVTDEWLRKNESIYPLKEEHENDKNYIESSEENWIITETYVEKTYYKIEDKFPSDYNPIIHNLVLSDRDDWEYGDIIYRTYFLSHKSSEEISDFISSKTVVSKDISHSEYIEKPPHDWLYDFDNDTIIKTYWKIIKDPDRLNYDPFFYIIEPLDQFLWRHDDENIFERCSFKEKEYEVIKHQLFNVIANNRKKKENDTIDIDGKPIPCDRDFRNMLIQKIINKDAYEKIHIKLNATFVVIAIDQIKNILNQIDNYVQTLFEEEYQMWCRIRSAKSLDDFKKIKEDISNQFLEAERD